NLALMLLPYSFDDIKVELEGWKDLSEQRKSTVKDGISSKLLALLVLSFIFANICFSQNRLKKAIDLLSFALSLVEESHFFSKDSFLPMILWYTSCVR